MIKQDLNQKNHTPEDWNILVIEDSDTDLEILIEYFEEIGIRKFSSFVCAEDAFLENNIEEFSCVLLDYSLPGMSGLECLEKIQDLSSSPPVIFLSGYCDEKVAIESMKKGASDYVLKDQFSSKGLYRAISNSLEKKIIENKFLARHQEAQNFAYIVAHDLKSPLRAIALLSESLESELKDKRPDLRRCRKVCAQVRSSELYIRNLLNGLVSYIQYGQTNQNFKTLDLIEILAKVISVHKSRESPEHLEIQSDPLPQVFGDPIGFTQVFQNLINNAINYNDKKKTVINIHCFEEEAFWKFECQWSSKIEPHGRAKLSHFG